MGTIKNNKSPLIWTSTEKLEEENMGVESPEHESETDDEKDVEGNDDKSDDDDHLKKFTPEEEAEKLREILGTSDLAEESDSLFKGPPRTNDKANSRKVPTQFSFDAAVRGKLLGDDLEEKRSRNARARSVPDIKDTMPTERRNRLQRMGAVKEGTATQPNYWTNRK